MNMTENDWIGDKGVSRCRFIKYEEAAVAHYSLQRYKVIQMTFTYKDMWS